MAYIFLSYSREDAARAQVIAQRLGNEGFSVVLDPAIPPGKTYEEAVAENLARAAAVVALWSATSIQKDVVKEEASRGQARDILVSVQLDPGLSLPLGIAARDAADLSSWNGDIDHAQWRFLVGRLRSLAGGAPAPAASAPAPAAVAPPPPPRPVYTPPPPASYYEPERAPKSGGRTLLFVLGALVVFVGLPALYYFVGRPMQQQMMCGGEEWGGLATEEDMTRLQSYLDDCPNGRFIQIARARHTELAARAEREAAAERAAYESAVNVRSRTAYEGYLAGFPNGANAEDVRARLASCRVVTENIRAPAPTSRRLRQTRNRSTCVAAGQAAQDAVDAECRALGGRTSDIDGERGYVGDVCVASRMATCTYTPSVSRAVESCD